MRIGIEIGWGNRAGGMRVTARQLVRAMAKLEPNWRFIVISNAEQPGLDYANIEQHIMPIPHQRLYNLYTNIIFPHLQVPRFFKRKGIDLVHYTSNAISFWRPFKTVLTLHDLAAFRVPRSSLTFFLRQYTKFHQRALAKKANAIITVSRNSAADIKEILGVPESRIRIIPNGVGEEFRVIDDREKLEEARGRLNLPARFILFVGTVEPRKNPGRLLEAYSRLKGHQWSLVLVGRMGRGKVDIARMARRLKIDDRVVYIEDAEQSDLPYIYNMADLFVYPSLYEGFGLPPLEAMSCGVPVIASGRSSIPEVVGDAAILFDPEDVGDIARAMTEALTNDELRKRLISKGHERVKQYSWKRSARETLDLYKELCNESMPLRHI